MSKEMLASEAEISIEEKKALAKERVEAGELAEAELRKVFPYGSLQTHLYWDEKAREAFKDNPAIDKYKEIDAQFRSDIPGADIVASYLIEEWANNDFQYPELFTVFVDRTAREAFLKGEETGPTRGYFEVDQAAGCADGYSVVREGSILKLIQHMS